MTLPSMTLTLHLITTCLIRSSRHLISIFMTSLTPHYRGRGGGGKLAPVPLFDRPFVRLSLCSALPLFGRAFDLPDTNDLISTSPAPAHLLLRNSFVLDDSSLRNSFVFSLYRGINTTTVSDRKSGLFPLNVAYSLMFKIISSPARILLSNSSSKEWPQHCAVRSMYISLGAPKHERSSISAACDWRHAKSSTADFNESQGPMRTSFTESPLNKGAPRRNSELQSILWKPSNSLCSSSTSE